jgi:antitoxin component YwqK of YwqJK toxin-antitoxin module/Tfp pilus assembly protein PilF
MTKFFVASSLTLLLINLTAGAQENNPLIISGQLIQQAGNLYDSGQYKKAIALYSQIDRNDTNYVRATYGIGSCYFADSDFVRAMEYTQKGISVARSGEWEPDLYNQYGNTLDAMEDREKALHFFDSAIRKYPAYSILYLNKGVVLMNLNRWNEAEAVFKQALLIDPYCYSAHYKLGYCALQQGKLLPAMLGFVGYLLVNPEGRHKSSCIHWLGAIANNTDTIQSLLSRRTQDPDENYQLLEQILQSKIALNKSYKTLIQLDDPISRQIQVVFEKMEYQPSDSDFAMQYYVPFFKSTFNDHHFEYFINRIFLGVDIPVIKDFNKKYKKDITALTDDLVVYLNAIRSSRELIYSKRGTDSSAWYFTNGKLSSHGIFLPKPEKLLGDWSFYYGAGNVRFLASYDKDGNKQGPSTYYFFDGSLKGKESYQNGKQEGEERYYFSNGMPSSHSWYKNGLLDGESSTYFWTGSLRTVTRYSAGKANGVKVTYVANGDTSLVETYRLDTLTGSVCSFSKYGTPEVVAFYKNGEFDGPYKKYYPNGQLQTAGDYKNGKQEGEWRSWYANGQVKSVDHFVKNKAEGEYREYYENGTLRYSGNQKSGSFVGSLRYNDDDGKLYSILDYAGGKLQKGQYFDNTGNLLSTSAIADGKITLLEYTPDGVKLMQHTYNEKEETTGTETFYYPSGKISETIEYLDGSQQGPSTTYYADGRKKSETMYADGKMDGYHRSWYSHGQIQEEGWYKADQGQGYWIYHDELGNLTDSSYYTDDNLDGYKTDYTPNGKKESEFRYHSGWLVEWAQYDTTGKELKRFYLPGGTGQIRLIYPNGKPNRSFDYLRGEPLGPQTKWFFDGNLMETFWYKKGMQDSTYRAYYHNGTVSTEGQFRQGEKSGAWKYYDRNGKLNETEPYVHGQLDGLDTRYYDNGKPEFEIFYKEGKKQGRGRNFDPDGTLLYQVRYKDDDPIAYTYLDSKDSLVPEIPVLHNSGMLRAFFPNGKVSHTGEYLNGVFTGEQKLYYINGQVRRVLNRVNGVLEGSCITYYANGQLKMSTTYLHDNLHGLAREYNDKGVLKEESNYYNGALHGITRLFDDAGQVRETDYYYYGILLSAKK